jgi:hypothetical protein
MQKIFLSFFVMFFSITVMSQGLTGINYQAIARNLNGTTLNNQSVQVRFTITQGNTATVQYQETQNATTNAYGLFNLVIGKGTPITGTFATVPWINANQWLQVEISVGGGAMASLGKNPFYAAPFSMTAASATPGGPAGGDLTGTYPNPLLVNTSVGAGNYGNATNYPTFTVDAKGRLINANTLPLPTTLPPSGPASGDLTGNYPSPTLVTSGVAAGAYGNATNYSTFTVDTKGRLTTAGQLALPTSLPPNGAAGGDLTGTYPNPTLTTSGVAAGAYGNATNYSTFTVDTKGRLTTAGQLALPTTLPPSGTAGGDLGGTYPNPNVVRLQNRPMSAAAPNNNDVVSWNGTNWIPASVGSLGAVTGSGTPNFHAKFTPTGTVIGNSKIFDDGTNLGISTVTPTGQVHIKGKNNLFDAGIRLEDDGSTEFGDILNGQEGLIYFAQTAGNDHLFLTNTFGSVANPAMIIKDNGNIGLGVGTSPTANLDLNGQLRIRGGTPGVGKFLVSDATGTGSWVSVAPGGVGGGGTLNFIPKWTPSGIALGNSLLFDNGNSIGLGTTTPSHRLDVTHSGSTGIGVNSTSGFSVVDINAASGDAALRFGNAGVNQWNIRNRPADNYLEIFELGGGGSRMVIQDATGNVGIGATVSPSYKLDIEHGGSTGERIKSTASFSVLDIDAFSGDAALRFANNGVNQWNMRNRPGDNYLEIFELGGGGSRMVIQDATGNVGIGATVSPSYKLDVEHGGSTGIRSKSTASFSVVDIDAASGDAALRFQKAGVNQWNIRNRPSDDYLEIFELGGGGSRMVIQDATGNVGIGATTSPSYKLDIEHGGSTGERIKSTASFSVLDIDAFSGDAALRFANNGVNQWNMRNRPGDNYLEIFELGGGGSRMVIQDATGNVGIGATINPSYKLDVEHGGSTGERIKSTASFSVLDIDAFSGDAAIRLANNGVNQWNIRNQPGTDNLQIFELGGGGERMHIENTTGNVSIGGGAPTAKLHVFGNFTATGVKAFTIDHPLDPENKMLRHFAVESNEVMNSYSGNITTNASGKAIVKLPDYFESINKDFRYQLTVMGSSFAQAIIAKKVNNNQFEIATNQPNVEVSWEVKGVRNDMYMKNVNTLQAEEIKPAEIKGKYLSPEAYKLPESRGVCYESATEPVENSITKQAPIASKAKVISDAGTTVSEEANQPKSAIKTAEIDNSGSVANQPKTIVSTAKVSDLTGTVSDEKIIPTVKPSTNAIDNKGSVSDEIIKPAAKPVEKTTNTKVAEVQINTIEKTATNATGTGAKKVDAPKAKATTSNTQKSTGE